MAGIQIPIGGDVAPFLAAVNQLRAAMQDLSNVMRQAMAPAQAVAQETRKSMVNAATGATQASGGFKGIVGAASNAGMAIANIAAGAKGVRSAFNFLSGLPPAWKKVAAAAAATGVAILGIVGAVKVVKSAFSALLSVAGTVWRGIHSGAASAASAVKGVFSGMASAVPGGSLLGPLAGIAGIAGAAALVTTQLKGAFEAAAAFEDLEVRVSSFLGSTEAAGALLKELSTFADKTPFATKDIQEAAGTILGAGIRGDVAGLTKDIAAVSRNGQQLRELADAVGKGFAKGKFQTEELNKFLERGINLMPALEQSTGLTGKALRKAIEDGLGFETVSGALKSLSQEGGMFYGLLERRSKTAIGLVSTLASVWDTVRRTFAQPIVDAIKPLLTDAIGMVESFKATALQAGQAVGKALLAAFALVKSGQTFELLRAGFAFAITGAIDILMRGLKSAVAFLAAALPPIFEYAAGRVTDPLLWDAVGSKLMAVTKRMAEEIRWAFPGRSEADYQKGYKDSYALDARAENMLATWNHRRIAGNIADVMSKALGAGLSAAGDEFGAPASDAFKSARDTMLELLRSVSAEAEKLRAGSAVPDPAKGATGEGSGQRLDPVTGALKDVMTLTTSLGRVGGGGFGMTFTPMLSEQRRSNTLLTKIENNTRSRGMTAPIV